MKDRAYAWLDDAVSVPSSSGRSVRRGLQYLKIWVTGGSFSPLLIGEIGATLADYMEAIAFLSGFSPLLIGEIGATFQVRLQYVCGRLVSVPSSSGRSVRLAKWFENGTPLTSRFSPLLIGEIGATIYFGPRDERISQVSVPSSSGRSVRLGHLDRNVRGVEGFSPLLIGEIGATGRII